MKFLTIQCPKCGEWLLREIESKEQLSKYKLKCVYCNRSSKVYSPKHGWRVNTRKCHSREEALQYIKLIKDKEKIIYKNT